MRGIATRLTVAASLSLLCCGVAGAQVSPSQAVPQTAGNVAPADGAVAPRTPGDTGALQNNQGKMSATVGSIDSHLLNAEKDRPRLPNQAPSQSQTLPGGTASSQTPR